MGNIYLYIYSYTAGINNITSEINIDFKNYFENKLSLRRSILSA